MVAEQGVRQRLFALAYKHRVFIKDKNQIIPKSWTSPQAALR